MKAEPHLDARGICERFNIGRRTLSNWLKDEEFAFPKPFEINRRLYWRRSAIEAWEIARGAPAKDEDKGNLKLLSKNIRGYADLVQTLTKRRKALKLSCLEVDARAGMQEGYTNKLENPDRPYGRRAGPGILDLWLGALDAAMVLVELPRGKERLQEKSKRVMASLNRDKAT